MLELQENHSEVAEREIPDKSLVHWPPKRSVFGVEVSATSYDESVETVLAAARQGQAAIVSCHAVHALITACDDPVLRQQVNTFDLVTPDGQPVRWALNLLHKARLRRRVYGPELMLRLCAAAAAQRVPIYLYGGSPDVARDLPERLQARFSGLVIAGSESPPYRPLSAEEDEALVGRIRASGARILFIGLGCPKQDVFAYEHRDRLRLVQVCVGAAFDFHAGAKKMAPAWMQKYGLEWLFRLGQEPQRLWKRYLVTNSRFTARLAVAYFRGSK